MAVWVAVWRPQSPLADGWVHRVPVVEDVRRQVGVGMHGSFHLGPGVAYRV
ncbi:hypothetical protein DVS28_b0303 (plasmid) [Euzebya pacifica]|uniref:Uncharacterized protein n=1 Tax=Euzebya pacifica TaxID=1608957 RepID=A0A346Y6H6_9ACTN|nr:hypothetical protein DVS28_b0303 [Euzebya pacifica]